MGSNLIADRLEGVLRDVLSEAGSDLLVVAPSDDAIETLVDVASEDGEPTVRLLADGRVLRDTMDDFLVASAAADLVEDGDLTVRTTDASPTNELLLAEGRVVALVDAGERVAGLVGDDGEFVEAAAETYEGLWEDGEEYSLRTPPISTVMATLEEELGAEARADFTALLEAASRTDDGLDEVAISLLVAARNEALLYDVSKWGEDVGIASKATFSRTKTQLEESGIVDTEKVPIEVGRPRLRLKLGDDRLLDVDRDEFVEEVIAELD